MFPHGSNRIKPDELDEPVGPWTGSVILRM